MWDKLRAAIVLLGLAGAAAYLCWREGEVVAGIAQVVDGDTVRIAGAVIRLKGLDAPEMQQTCSRGGETYRCGEAARGALVRLASDGIMRCRIEGKDKYRRALGRCFVHDEDVGARLVQSGWAVGYGGYRLEEVRAQADKAGLWSGSFQKPADWRREHRPAGPH